MMAKKKVLSALLGLTLLNVAVAFGFEQKPGFDVRFRYENWDNLITLGTNSASNSFKDRNFFRLRVMLWDEVKFSNQTSLMVRLNTEPKYQMGPYYHMLKDGTDRRKFDQDEVIIDNLYLDLKRVLGLPLNLRIGRQDFLGKDMYGEGFLILDGTPGDGSRSFYFNAIKGVLTFTPKNTIDIVLVRNTMRDIFLPSIHPAYDDRPPALDNRGSLFIKHKKRFTGSNELGFWVYSRNKFSNGLELEPYYIYKKEEEDRQYGGPKFASYLHNLGARAVYGFKLAKVRAELVRQFGEYSNGTDRRAWGGYVFVEKSFPSCPMKPKVEIGYVYLSGDDPKSKKDEGFNPLFSRNPNWNELIIYTYLLETMSKAGPIPGYWTNLKMPLVNLYLTPLANLSLKLGYQKLYADEKTQRLPSYMFSNDGTDRGDLYLIMANYQFRKGLTGMLQYEIFDPDDFYAKKAKTAHFFRAELRYRY
jgi:hypothetical protein